MSLEMTRRSLCARVLSGMMLGGMTVAIVSAADKTDNPVGTWKMVSTSGQGDVNWTLVIAGQDGKYTAKSDTGDGGNAVENLKVDGKKVHFTVNYQGAPYEIDLSVQGDALVGAWSGGDANGETHGTRVTTGA